ncbi:MAG: phosphoglucosamine mutase [Acidobacteria bacterium OLB17]|nr:MAG: phosphoglucosamine mutase [Acidobacteria bacterium OLB17]MCZ2389953.1 phosphoglucosamine mutase [Acidobacteriota bacterium]
MGKFFGTDGVRGRAGEFPLDDATVSIIGRSLARHFAARLGRMPRFVSGRDTRESGLAIESALHGGVTAEGAQISSAGVITTPGVAFLAGAEGFDAGIVISASHNPFEDNGIKVFLPSGKKLDSDIERLIEGDIEDSSLEPVSPIAPNEDLAEGFDEAYLESLRAAADGVSLAGLSVVIDCANGAAYDLAPKLFRSLGAELTVINDSPDGRNINKNCGSLHLEMLAAKVVETGSDLGAAFDGDADRVLFVDRQGNVVDGDATLWILAGEMRANGKLANRKVVATVMSNLGLEVAFKGAEIELLRTKVGDKYVLEELICTGSEIGGEQSGHIIFPERCLVGDGMATAVLTLASLARRGISLEDAAREFRRYPQVLLNVVVKEKVPFEDVPAIMEAAAELEKELSESGRLLLRYSGTENLARVMIEGQDQADIEKKAADLAAVIREALG